MKAILNFITFYLFSEKHKDIQKLKKKLFTYAYKHTTSQKKLKISNNLEILLNKITIFYYNFLSNH